MSRARPSVATRQGSSVLLTQLGHDVICIASEQFSLIFHILRCRLGLRFTSSLTYEKSNVPVRIPVDLSFKFRGHFGLQWSIVGCRTQLHVQHHYITTPLVLSTYNSKYHLYVCSMQILWYRFVRVLVLNHVFYCTWFGPTLYSFG